MDWNVLGIEPTNDKKAITLAYRSALAHTNPEDKPEEFMKLREAYEEALSLAKQAAGQFSGEAPLDEAALSPLDRWVADLEAIYSDFQRRIDTDEWKRLLSDDVCIALDTRSQAEEALFKFLSEERYLDREVWCIFNERFSWLDRRTELYERYPRGFIDNVVVESILFNPLIDYKLFSPGKDSEVCDEYVRQFIRTINTPVDQAESPALELLSFSERHPYGDAYLAFVRAMGGSLEALSTLREIWGANQGEVYIAQLYAEALINEERFEEAEVVALAARDIDKTNRNSIWLLASTYAFEGKYKNAIECINELMLTSGGNQHDLFTLNEVRTEWNVSLIKQYEEVLEQEPDRWDTVLDLGWCYLQNDILDKSRALADRLNLDNTEPYDYYNFVSQLNLAEGHFQASYDDSRKLADIISAMEHDGTDKTEKRIGRLQSVIARCGYCMFCLKRKEECIATYEEALALSPEDQDTLYEYARILVALGERKRGMEMVERLIDVKPTLYFPYFMLAQMYFDERNDRDAFYAINRALEIETSDLGVYILKLRILIRNGAIEEAREILDYLHAIGCEDDLGVLWMDGLMSEVNAERPGQNRTKCLLKAQLIYREIIKRIEEGEEFGFASAIYFRAAVMEGMLHDVQTEEIRQRQLDLIEKALESEPDNADYLDYRAWLLARLNREGEAIRIYEKLVEREHAGTDPEEALADIYRKDLKHYADKALPLYRQLVANAPDNVFYLYYNALCALRLRELNEAERLLIHERELEPDCTDPYRLLFFVYLAMNRNEDALAQINACIAIASADNDAPLALYRLKTRVLRRLERWDEAIANVYTAAEIYPTRNFYRVLFEIYVQASRYDDAQKLLDEWARARGEDGKPVDRSGIVAPRLLIKLFRDGPEAAKAHGTKGRSYLRKNDKKEFMMLVNYLNGNFKGCVEILEKDVVIRAESEDSEIADKLAPLAAFYWRMGEFDKAKNTAEIALAICNNVLNQFTTYEPLFYCKRAIAHAILGREDCARRDLETARSLPLCEQCSYRCCKDADFYEAYLEDFCGNYETALELTRKGMTQWPDESDFWCFEQYLLSKAPGKQTVPTEPDRQAGLAKPDRQAGPTGSDRQTDTGQPSQAGPTG